VATVTIDATWGGAEANAYLDYANANTLISNNFLDFSCWENANEDDCLRALIVATSNIDSVDWYGARYYFDQSLEFPRTPAGDANYYGFSTRGPDGGLLVSEVDDFQERLQSRVYKATVAQALFLLQTRNSGNQKPQKHRDMQKLGITSWSKSFSGVSESFSYNPSNVTQLCQDAWDHLRMYKAPTRVVRGDSGGFGFR
jgi:hypothetical protein